jgi:hypothetical protein
MARIRLVALVFRNDGELASGTMTLLAQVRAGVEANMAVVANLEALRN